MCLIFNKRSDLFFCKLHIFIYDHFFPVSTLLGWPLPFVNRFFFVPYTQIHSHATYEIVLVANFKIRK